MKREMFTTATVEDALNTLEEYGAMIPKETAAYAKAKKIGVIIGKFTQQINCFDGYCITETPKDVIKMLRKEAPNEDISSLKYILIVCRGCKNNDELMKGLGF